VAATRNKVKKRNAKQGTGALHRPCCEAGRRKVLGGLRHWWALVRGYVMPRQRLESWKPVWNLCGPSSGRILVFTPPWINPRQGKFPEEP
jgi:hypothetical protein